MTKHPGPAKRELSGAMDYSHSLARHLQRLRMSLQGFLLQAAASPAQQW